VQQLSHCGFYCLSALLAEQHSVKKTHPSNPVWTKVIRLRLKEKTEAEPRGPEEKEGSNQRLTLKVLIGWDKQVNRGSRKIQMC